MVKKQRDPKYESYRWRVKMTKHVDHDCDAFYTQLNVLLGAGRTFDVAKEWAPLVRAAALDAWLIHTRSLLYFFDEVQHGSHSEVLARHYLREPTWQQHKSFFIPDQTIWNRIHDIGAFVAHLNPRRAEKDAAEATNWGSQEVRWVSSRLQRWYELLDPRWQRRFPRLKRWLNGWDGP